MRISCYVTFLRLCWCLGTLDSIQSLSVPSITQLPPKATQSTIPSNTNLQPKTVKRVCIVGAGIAGLTLAHGLTNSPSLMRDSKTAMEDGIEVSIFDSRKSLDYTAGSGVQLNGGMACLGRLNPDVLNAVIDAAIPVKGIKARHKSWQSEGNGNNLSRLWDYSILNVIKDAGEKVRDDLLDENDNPLWYAIMRGALQEVLLDTLPTRPQLQVQFSKTLTSIISDDNGDDGSGGAFCQFADGTTAGPFDLIVGCDGIKSAVKEYIEMGRISEDARKREGNSAALYSGVRINYAIRDQEEAKANGKQVSFLQQIFADGAYALSGTYGNGKDRPACDCFFVISLDDGFNGPFKRRNRLDDNVDRQLDSVSSDPNATDGENADWTQNVRKPKDETREKMQKQIDRYGVYDEDARNTIDNADRFFELGVYFHNPLSFTGWSKQIPSTDGSFAVLCGDAAHAMPPFLGQGANQAIQDAYSLAQRIHTINGKVEQISVNSDENSLPDDDSTEEKPQTLKSTLKEYERVRWSPTASITLKAAILGYLETGGRGGFYSKFRDLFFRTLYILGIPKLVLLDSATPRV